MINKASGEEATAVLQKSDLFASGDGGYEMYRVPGIVVANNGTVIVYCEARKGSSDWAQMDILMRRSTDNGATWEPRVKLADGVSSGNTVNNPLMIVEQTGGTVHFLYCQDYARCFYRKSRDNGLTWSEPVEITSVFDRFKAEYNWVVIATGPCHGVQLKNGRLVVPVWLATSIEHKPSLVATIYSDDHGATWQRGEIIPDCDRLVNPSETGVVELADGTVLLNVRNEFPEKRRAITKSPNGATDWRTPYFDRSLPDPTCCAGIIGFNDQGTRRILFSNCNGTEKRSDLTIRMSLDAGETWAYSKLLQAGGAAYSDIAVGPDGTVYCFYERNEGETRYQYLTLARFNIEWLTN